MGSKVQTNEPLRAKESSSSIPVIGEKYSISKPLKMRDFIVEKKWATKRITVPVSVRYEEIYVNGKRMGSGYEHFLASLKGAVNEEGKQANIDKKKGRLKGESVPLHGKGSKTHEIITLYGEEIILNKRMRVFGEAVISKRRVTKNRQVSINLKGERVIVKHLDGTQENVQEKPFTSLAS